MSPAELLALLLDWLNDEYPERHLVLGKRDDVVRMLTRFIASFDGSKASGLIRAGIFVDGELDENDKVVPKKRRWLFDDDELSDLHASLRVLLHAALGPEQGVTAPLGDDVQEAHQRRLLPSLIFGIERIAAIKPDRQERRKVKRNGGPCILHVEGNRVDLVLYLVMQLLTRPGAIALARCEAPAPRNWEARCGRLLITTSRGRHRRFCKGTACRVRAHAENIDLLEGAPLHSKPRLTAKPQKTKRSTK